MSGPVKYTGVQIIDLLINSIYDMHILYKMYIMHKKIFLPSCVDIKCVVLQVYAKMSIKYLFHSWYKAYHNLQEKWRNTGEG